MPNTAPIADSCRADGAVHTQDRRVSSSEKCACNAGIRSFAWSSVGVRLAVPSVEKMSKRRLVTFRRDVMRMPDEYGGNISDHLYAVQSRVFGDCCVPASGDGRLHFSSYQVADRTEASVSARKATDVSLEAAAWRRPVRLRASSLRSLSANSDHFHVCRDPSLSLFLASQAHGVVQLLSFCF